MHTVTPAPSCTSFDTTSATLYAAIPPQTPTTISRPLRGGADVGSGDMSGGVVEWWGGGVREWWGGRSLLHHTTTPSLHHILTTWAGRARSPRSRWRSCP